MSLESIINYFVVGVTEITRVIVLTIWSVVGFIFWIPFLARMIATFSGSVVAATFTGYDPSAARMGLESSVRFYSDGFALIQESIQSIHQRKPLKKGLVEALGFARIGRILLELVWSALFWSTLILLLYPR